MILIGEPEIALLKCSFLQSIWQMAWDSTVFLDETWLNKNIGSVKKKSDGSVKINFNDAKICKGKWLIILHVRSTSWWIDSPSLIILQGKQTTTTRK